MGEKYMSWENTLKAKCDGPTKKTSSTSKGKKWMQCVSDGKGGHKRVHWGQKGVTVSGKRSGKRRSSFRARHKCSSCKGKDKSPRCMACRDW
jgi:hypothetical protein